LWLYCQSLFSCGKDGNRKEFRDAPDTDAWIKGRGIDGTTLPGTMIASGWDANEKYPNKSSGNHTGIYMGSNIILEQNVGTPGSYQVRTLSSGEIGQFHEVRSRDRYDSAKTKSTIGYKRNP
jgi:hypothetical protein